MIDPKQIEEWRTAAAWRPAPRRGSQRRALTDHESREIEALIIAGANDALRSMAHELVSDGVSRMDIAAVAGVRDDTVGRWVSEKARESAPDLRRLARVAVPALLAEVERLRGEVAVIRDHPGGGEPPSWFQVTIQASDRAARDRAVAWVRKVEQAREDGPPGCLADAAMLLRSRDPDVAAKLDDLIREWPIGGG